DYEVLSAALLHDTVEDTATTHEELLDAFGSRIARIVAEVTDDQDLPKHERKRLQIEHAPHLSDGAKLVKLADKICNLRDVAERRGVPAGGSVVLRAQGVGEAAQGEADWWVLKAFDATCPLVTKVHIEVMKMLREHCEIVVIGHHGHPEAEGAMGQSPAGMHL